MSQFLLFFSLIFFQIVCVAVTGLPSSVDILDISEDVLPVTKTGDFE